MIIIRTEFFITLLWKHPPQNVATLFYQPAGQALN